MKDWLYFFLDALGRSFFYRNGMSSVGSTNMQEPVRHAPDGWEDIAVGYERDLKEHGMVRTFSFPLKGVEDAARILRELMYTKGLEQEIYLLITRATVEMSDTVFKHYHKMWYRGRVDMASIIDEETYVTFKVEDGGLAKQLKTNRATKYDIPLEGSGAVRVYLDGVSLQQTNNFLINKVATASSALVDCGQTSYEGRAAGFSGHQVFTGFVPQNLATSDDYLFRTHIPITGLKMKGTVKLERPTYYWMRLYTSKGRIIEVIPYNTGLGLRKDFSFDLTFDGQSDERFFLVGGAPDLAVYYEESTFTISFEGQATPSYCWCMPLSVCLDRILEKITGKTGQWTSQLLTTAPYKNLMITCGDGLRALPGAGLKISYNDLNEYIRVICRAGFGIENEKVVVEDLLYFYRRSSAINLGVAAGLKVTPADELLGNTVKIGYKMPEIDDVNGRYAFNCAHLYEVSPKADCKVRELNYVANCITDPYAIEITRINFDGKLTTDGQFDNEHFILHCTNEAQAVEPPVSASCERTASLFILNIQNVIPFQIMNATPAGSFTFSADRTQVTFAGTRPREMDITGRCRWAAGKNAQLHLVVNGTVVAHVQAVSDGTTAQVVTTRRMMQPGDTTWIEVINTESNQVLYASLDLSSVAQGANDWRLYRADYEEIDGLPEKAKATVFNIELLTPKRLLLLHAPWLNGSFYLMWLRQAVYKFLSTERNRELRTRRVTPIMDLTVDEDADQVIDSENYLFKPWFFEFDVSAPPDMVEVMQLNPYRPYVFTWNDKPFIGYLIKGGIAPDDDKPMVFRLLCTPDTDLLPLLNN